MVIFYSPSCFGRISVNVKDAGRTTVVFFLPLRIYKANFPKYVRRAYFWDPCCSPDIICRLHLHSWFLSRAGSHHLASV
jgi:hypothetical protein